MATTKTPLTPIGPVLEVTIEGVDLPAGQVVPITGTVNLLVDTGSTRTAILPSAMQRLSIAGSGGVTANTPAGPQLQLEYDVALSIPQLGLRKVLKVAGLPSMSFGLDGLLGQDVLEEWVMLYDGPAKLVTFTYQGHPLSGP